MLTASEAADIAKRAGLTLADAVSLRLLADDTAHASTLAAKFAANNDDPDTDAKTEYVRGLFGTTDRQDDPDATDEQNFTRKLFDRPPDDAA